jgi:peptidoglycan/xylan/chitin deacetylase (PgdA/CDA1 family)
MLKRFAMLGLSLMILAGCAKEVENIPNEENVPIEVDPKELIDLSLKPNESGKIMILMYHNIGEEEQTWTRTVDNLKKDLETLYEKGYRPISLSDYVTGNITTELGYTPVVLTFDDGNLNNYRYLEDGSLDPNCAVGILVEFNRTHPDFPLEATFFITSSNPFKQSQYAKEKVEALIEMGMDIGNHSKDHMNFKDASKDDLEEQLGYQAQYLETFTPEGYRVNTLALPYGSRPKNKDLEIYLQKGQYEDYSYENIAILNVGWFPAVSPYHIDFNPLSLPRVRASEMNVDNVGMYNYLSYFDNHPEEKFISDGNPDIITIPEDLVDKLTINESKELYTYPRQ